MPLYPKDTLYVTLPLTVQVESFVVTVGAKVLVITSVESFLFFKVIVTDELSLFHSNEASYESSTTTSVVFS